MPLALHPSLKKLPLNSRLWIENAEGKKELHGLVQSLVGFLDLPNHLDAKPYNRIGWISNYYCVAAFDAFCREDEENFHVFLKWSIAFSAIVFRWDGMYSELRQDLGNWPREFRDSLRAAGPMILSRWDEAKICAVRFIEMAEKDQRVNVVRGSRRIKQGTSDAFLINLFAQAFDLKTSFIPPKPLIPEYRVLLDNWRTADQSVFKQAMQAAADFHISRSKSNTNSKFYEFDNIFDRIFPAELLSIQALRRRDGLPGFETGHLLVDTPWSVIKDLPEVEPHPLAVAVEARLKKDYPLFR
jgi:hypothetical protein